MDSVSSMIFNNPRCGWETNHVINKKCNMGLKGIFCVIFLDEIGDSIKLLTHNFILDN